MELTQKNDSVLAGATKAGRDSNGGYSYESQDLMPTNTGFLPSLFETPGQPDGRPGSAELVDAAFPAGGSIPWPMRTRP